MQVVEIVLFDFEGHVIHPPGQITLPLTLGDKPRQETNMTFFLVVDVPLAYNINPG